MESEKLGMNFVDKIEASNGQNLKTAIILNDSSSTSHVISPAIDITMWRGNLHLSQELDSLTDDFAKCLENRAGFESWELPYW
ncbi:hypothetical protein PVK06_024856 [Gossypium arboreum]|uniref:Uncharacterized protein n=1 Tax=Gossypium arboreum TaxID=29729 RepID=A0ABR0PF40_GOSAR|nr:hypothetical protein PVK06_024856 [Gossypium arboreum]